MILYVVKNFHPFTNSCSQTCLRSLTHLIVEPKLRLDFGLFAKQTNITSSFTSVFFSVAKQGKKNNETRKKHAQSHRKIKRIYLGTMTRCGSFRIHSHSNKDGDESCKHRPTPLLSTAKPALSISAFTITGLKFLKFQPSVCFSMGHNGRVSPKKRQPTFTLLGHSGPPSSAFI